MWKSILNLFPGKRGGANTIPRPGSDAANEAGRQPNITPAAGSHVINEHFVPQAGVEDIQVYIRRGDVAAVHHLLRYQWAVRVLADTAPMEQVLDIACGSGYGTHMMAAARPDVQFVGCDYDPTAVHSAQANYRRPNLKFRLGDVLRWEETMGQGCFDAIVSFDTLEHVEHREIMLENLVRHLQPAGQVLLSTPCGGPANELQPAWKFHKIEYSAASLYDLLHRYFRRVIRPDEGEMPHLEIFDVLNGSAVTYLLRMNPVLCLEPITFANPYIYVS